MSLLHENTAFSSGDSRQDSNISANKCGKEGKTTLLSANSSGDSRQEVYNNNYGIQSDIVSDDIPVSLKEVSSGDSRHDVFVTHRLFAFYHVSNND